jgi:hypothetical protein
MASIPPPRHMNLRQLTVLASRLMAVPIVKEADTNKAEKELIQKFAATVDTLEYDVVAQKRLSGYLAHQAGRVRQYVPTMQSSEVATGRVFVRKLGTALRQFTCQDCAGADGHQCDGVDHARDSAQVAARGQCLQIVREMHKHVLTYWPIIKLWGWTGNDLEVPTFDDRWVSVWREAQSDIPGSDPKVEAKTSFLDKAATKPFAEVQLIVEVDHLDWKSLLQVLWLFTHEYICHVWQAPKNGLARPICNSACPFFEGWMDEVARRFLQADLIGRAFEEPLFGFIHSLRAKMDDAATDYRTWRYGKAPGTRPPKEAKQWRVGVDAAEVTLQALELSMQSQDVDLGHQGALQQLVALSWRLQMAAQSAKELEEALIACQDACDRVLWREPLDTRQLFNTLSGEIAAIPLWIKELARA